MRIELPKKHYSYSNYRLLVETLLKDGKVTGNNQSNEWVDYTRLNLQRMHRWEKTYVPSSILEEKISRLNKPTNWVIITEGWCGDAAQQCPVISKWATLNPLISAHFVLRDENPQLMDLFLTNGSRSIPIWICADEQWNVMWTWGPRPEEAAQLLRALKESGVDDVEKKRQLHAWYAANKQAAFEQEVELLLV